MKRPHKKASQRVTASGRPRSDPVQSSGWKTYSNYIFGVALIAITFLVYQPAWFGKPLLDDTDRFVRTPELRSLNGLTSLWIQPRTTRQYHPLLDTAYWIMDKLWQENVLGYHLVTIALHAASALLLVRILQKLQIRGAWLAGTIFAIHPVEVESVAWMVELKNTISGFFFFAALLGYLRFEEKRKLSSYLLVLLFFTLGILAKAIVATLPAVVLILIWWQRGRINWNRDVKPLLPFVVLGIVSGLLTAWMERAFSGAEGEEFEFSALDRALIAGRAFWFYVGKIVWPTDLSFIYPRWKINLWSWWQYLFPLAGLGFFALAWQKRKQWPWLFAASLFFLVTVGPLLGFFNVNFFRFSFVADHFQYLPNLAIIVPFSAGAALLWDHLTSWQVPVGATVAAGVVALLGFLSWQQSHMYQDSEICYRTVIARNPESWTGYHNVGVALLKQGELDQAAANFRKVIELEPNDPWITKRAYVGLGSVYAKRGETDEAITQFQRALELDPTDGPAHNGLASVLHRRGRLGEAIAEYERAVELRPQSIMILSNFAWMLATCADPSLRDGPRALLLARQADQLSGSANPRVLRSLAAAYAEMGQFLDAAKAARRALQLSIQDNESLFKQALRHEITLFDMAKPYHETMR